MKQMELMAMQGRVFIGQQLKTMEDNLLPCGRFFCSQMKQMELMAMRGRILGQPYCEADRALQG